MTDDVARDDLAGGALLDEVARLHAEREQASVAILLAAGSWAGQCGEGSFDLDLVNRGGERFVRIGGAGTPRVAEFAPAVFGARLQLSPYAAGRLIADVLDLRHRLPLLWGRVQRLEVREGHARFVARKTRDLSIEQAAYVDERVAESADGRLSWARFETLVEAAIVAADPAAAQAREEAAATEQFARPTRSDEHGMRGFYVRANFATVARIDATVAYVADALLAMGDTGTLDERRVKAMLILANPTQAVELLEAYAQWRRTGEVAAQPIDESKLLPAVWLFVHTSGVSAGSTTGVARVEGMSPVTEEWVREHLGERCRFKITAAIDPLGQTPVDAYEIPDRHRQAVHLMTPADTFPFASSTSRGMQVDHTEEYRPGRSGQSRIGNYGPMVTFHHRIKTHSGWHVEQPYPGIYVWRDPYGAFYLVDHTGTRALRAA